MYKLASRSLQRFHKVHEIAPDSGPIQDDYIPSAENMGLREVESERAQLFIELTRIEQDLAIAKRERRSKEITFLGNKKAAMCARMAILRQRRSQLSREDHNQALSQAVREIAPEDIKRLIYARQAEILEELKARP